MYKYFIHRFTSEPVSFLDGDAKAKAYVGSSVQTITPPQGNGLFWHVLNMDSQGNIEIVNQILSSEP